MSSPIQPIRIRSVVPGAQDQSSSGPELVEKHRSLITSGTGYWADRIFEKAMLVAALSVLAIVLLILKELYSQSQLSIHEFGWKFFTTSNWDPVAGDFGALPFIYGTLVSSFLALLMAVARPIRVATFITDSFPLPPPSSFLTF